MNFSLIGIGLVMGMAFAVPPGAVTAETLRRGVRGGFVLALGVQMGSLIGDALYAILALAGLAVIADNSTLQIALGAFGAMFLIYLAWCSFKTAREPIKMLANHQVGSARLGAFLAGFALSVTNPWAIAFWLALGGTLGSLGIAGSSSKQVALFFTSFMMGSALWALVLSVGIARFRLMARPSVFRFVSILCGIALGAFSIIAAGRVATTLFGF